MFLIVMLIVGISSIAITYKTLVGYGSYPIWLKILSMVLLIVAWFSPLFLRMIRQQHWLTGEGYAVAAKFSYFLMGLAFILVLMLLLRDFVWYIIYFATRRAELNPNNTDLLQTLNIWTLLLALAVSFYGVYEANKTPTVKELTISDSRIKKPTKVVIASDFHIDQSTPMKQIKQFVDTINSLNADYVLLIGDIIDDVPEVLQKEMLELQKLQAEKIYLSLGNHEYYNAPHKWLIQFTNMGFKVLQNTGEAMADTGIFVAGVPDAHSAEVNYNRAGYGSTDDQYKVLMSHSPVTINELEEGQFNLQVSGHTHGGQIFPFNFLAQAANGYLAGMYEVNRNKLYITRGAGYWGPPMRVLAPSDITLIHFKGSDDAA